MINCHCAAIDSSECVCSRIFSKSFLTRMGISKALKALKARNDNRKYMAELENNKKMLKVLKAGDWICNEHGVPIGVFDGFQIQNRGCFSCEVQEGNTAFYDFKKNGRLL